MKVAFDSSVLVAAVLKQHPDRDRAAAWIHAARTKKIGAMATCHAFAETWATLTALPVEPRVGPDATSRLIADLAKHVRAVALSWKDYLGSFERCGAFGLRSGALYDALHLIAAERHDADVFLTFNTRHFTRLAAPESPRIVAPPDPPGLGALE